ncbi:MAG: glycogen/starch/alpha-glucan phosphorylase [Syntrophales bacterium LBB04]|nr:glycogen/starch/alpha-glucan phosphorylase [Syntrophales bacterium LBB04]
MHSSGYLKNTKVALKKSIVRHLRHSLGKEWPPESLRDIYLALGLSLRDRLVEGMLKTERRYRRRGCKRVYYLSMEYLIGRSMGNNLYNLGIYDTCRETLLDIGVEMEEIREQEGDASLGYGGLGRLAACFLDSMATQNIPGFGYGIHYNYGVFKQDIENGYQKEKPDYWSSENNPWEIQRPDEACIVPVYGRVEHDVDRFGNYNPMWLDWKAVVGVPYDMPVVGYGGHTVNYLRLYAARSSADFDMGIFNEGDYFRAVEQKIAAETISKVLYPDVVLESGRELRLMQEYFLVHCSLCDIVRRYLKDYDGFDAFADKVAIQMNDTHPSLAVAELMRLLMDEQDVPWEKAWEITRKTLAFTNHTLMSEALEKWPVGLMERVLPRHLQIIYGINYRFLNDVATRWPGDTERLKRMSLIEEGVEKRVRMANMAIIGSHSVNGVSKMHTELVKAKLVPDFYELWPERFNNKTNGVTPRRWLLKSNPGLSNIITRAIGEGWITDLSKLRLLEPSAHDAAFQESFRKIKRQNKEHLCRDIEHMTGVTIHPETLFDVQVKRIHEYKRQLLNIMHIIHEYLNLVEDHREPAIPRTCIFGGKAAPGYWQAKQMIKLIHNVGEVINRDPRAKDWIQVVFVPDYRVSLAEKIIPAADLSEQISAAGTEASGTGNMKFAMNGALTIGTLDGANIEIREEVGEENIYIFGLTIEEIEEMRRTGSYNPWEYYNRYPEIRRVLDALRDDRFSPREPCLFRWIGEKILNEGDFYYHLADFPQYLAAQKRVGEDYRNPNVWTQKAILNVARIGKFSSDRTILEYARDIWGIP